MVGIKGPRPPLPELMSREVYGTKKGGMNDRILRALRAFVSIAGVLVCLGGLFFGAVNEAAGETTSLAAPEEQETKAKTRPAAPPAQGKPAPQKKPRTPAKTPADQAAPADLAGQQGEIHVKARTWEKVEDRLIADGNVDVRYRTIALFADHVEIDTKTKDVLAVGRVVLHVVEEEQGGTAKTAPAGPAPASDASLADAAVKIVSGEQLEFNLDSALGRIRKAFGMAQPTLRFEAATLERKAGGIDGLVKASFTMCTQAVPRWKFSCARADIKRDDYIDMWGATFSLKGLPVFYWPYIRYPLNRDRSTGFLMPEVGYSGTKGVFLSEGFFWVISRAMDATFQLDYYGNRGVGGGAEWRYAFEGGKGGTLNLYYFLFKKDAPSLAAGTAAPSNGYLVRWKHDQNLPYGVQLAADVDVESSYTFLKEFDDNFQRALVSQRRSQVYLNKSWSFMNVNVRASQFETYYPSKRDSVVTRNLPQLSLNSYKIKLLGPAYLSFTGGFNSWQYGWQTAYDLGTERHGQQMNLAPTLSVPWSAAPWLSVNASVTGNFNYYFQTYDAKKAIVDDPLFIANANLNAALKGPSFYRIYDLKNGTRIKHLIEPALTYRYDTPVENRQLIVTPTGRFYIYHQLQYGLTHHIYMKRKEALPAAAEQEGPPKTAGAAEEKKGEAAPPAKDAAAAAESKPSEPAPAGQVLGKKTEGPSQAAGPTPAPPAAATEIFTWGLSQVFYLAPDLGPLSIYTVREKKPQWSEIQSYVRFFPGGHTQVDFAGAYNPYYTILSSLRLSATLGLPTDNLYLNVSWFKSVNAWRKGAAEESEIPIEYSSLLDRHQIRLAGGCRIPRWDLEAKGEVNYNIIQKKMLFAAGDVTYHYQCVDLRAEVRVFFYRNIPETRVTFSVSLGKVGQAQNLMGGIAE